MNQIKSGAVREALDRLMTRPIFSYGIVNNDSGMQINKPSGETGLVDFEYLAKTTPEPFRREWSGGQGIHIHHKFAVVDFDQPHAKVYTGSSNFSPAGESGNGDHMLVIANQRVAAAYAIEALRVFDHLAFRSRMKDAAANKERRASAARIAANNKPLLRLKPVAFTPKSQRDTWFAPSYAKGSQRERDRLRSRRRPLHIDRAQQAALFAFSRSSRLRRSSLGRWLAGRTGNDLLRGGIRQLRSRRVHQQCRELTVRQDAPSRSAPRRRHAAIGTARFGAACRRVTRKNFVM
jgi:hypothetical protein